jgi:hypothetical protein
VLLDEGSAIIFKKKKRIATGSLTFTSKRQNKTESFSFESNPTVVSKFTATRLI